MIGAIVAFAIASMFGLVAAAAPAATAATTATTVAVQSQGSGVQVATQCNIVPHRFAVYSKCNVKPKGYLCFIGNHETFKSYPKYASNGCEFDVDMYPTRGAKLCVRHNSSTGLLKANYASFRVTSNKGNC